MDIAEIISHHILDHSWGITFGELTLPITTHSVTIFGVSLFLLGALYLVSRRFQNTFGRLMTVVTEEYVTFVRDEMVLPSMGKEGKSFVPYFCTLFLFIVTLNLVGMIPNMKTATSNISVTAGLALCSGGLILFCGVKYQGFIGFLKSFVPSGTPGWLIPLIFPLEVLSTIIKVCVLAIRLFANMMAGHMVLLCLLLLIFIIGKMNLFAGVGSAVPALLLELFMSFLELLVAFLQAYVFTLLTAIFAGSVIHSH